MQTAPEKSPLRRFPNSAVSLEGLRDKRVAVLGYGAQGHAHALNLRDSGVHVTVAQRPGSARYAAAERDGFVPMDLSSAVETCDVLLMGLPDDALPAVYEQQIAGRLRAGQTLGFMHGLVIHAQQIAPPANVDVVLVAPKAQGHGLRRLFSSGSGAPALVAVHQNATGTALQTALGWAAGIGCGRSLVLETTFRDETETDLFGEQAVLCGGLSELVRAAFDTLVEAGYPEELAYLECCHELKLIADLIYAHGLTGARERISSTARFGDLTRGQRVIGAHVREAMRDVLREIRDGTFVQELTRDAAAGGDAGRRLHAQAASHPIEATGRRLRAEMGLETQAENDA